MTEDIFLINFQHLTRSDFQESIFNIFGELNHLSLLKDEMHQARLSSTSIHMHSQI